MLILMQKKVLFDKTPTPAYCMILAAFLMVVVVVVVEVGFSRSCFLQRCEGKMFLQCC